MEAKFGKRNHSGPTWWARLRDDGEPLVIWYDYYFDKGKWHYSAASQGMVADKTVKAHQVFLRAAWLNHLASIILSR